MSNQVLVEEFEGFKIYFEALDETQPLCEHIEDRQEVQRQIDNLEVEHFCAKVTAVFSGIELAEDYLGSCLYENEEDFYTKYKDDYYADMRRTVVDEARSNVKQMYESLVQVPDQQGSEECHY